MRMSNLPTADTEDAVKDPSNYRVYVTNSRKFEDLSMTLSDLSDVVLPVEETAEGTFHITAAAKINISRVLRRFAITCSEEVLEDNLEDFFHILIKHKPDSARRLSVLFEKLVVEDSLKTLIED